MHDDIELVLDTFCEVYPLLKPWACDEFWDFSQHDIRPGATYLMGRKQFIDNKARIRELTEKGTARFILSNPHEGSDTLRKQTMMYGMEDLFQQHRLLLIGGGDMDESWPCLRFDSFLPKLLDYQENVDAAARCWEIYHYVPKPYQFLFLNGRARWHRRWLIERWQKSGVLEKCLWTNLDSAAGPINLLPERYEVSRYQSHMSKPQSTGYVKFDLFDNEWGEIYLNPEAYIDTYFSVVTETVFDYPYSFRTEKIWKPIVMGQPWIVVANQGYLRDMHNLGFRTFGSLIDESYDQIECNQTRIQRIAEVVEDLCRQDLPSFIAAAKDICKYNQEHHAECRQQVRQDFPDRFFQFLKKFK